MKTRIFSVLTGFLMAFMVFVSFTKKAEAADLEATTEFDGANEVIAVSNLIIPEFVDGKELPDLPQFAYPTGGILTRVYGQYVVFDSEGTVEFGGKNWSPATGTIDSEKTYALQIVFLYPGPDSCNLSGAKITVEGVEFEKKIVINPHRVYTLVTISVEDDNDGNGDVSGNDDGKGVDDGGTSEISPAQEEPHNYISRLDDMLDSAIENAEATGKTTVVVWNEGAALPNNIMKKLYENPSVALDFKFTIDGIAHEVVIPPGMAVNNSTPWYGHENLLGTFGESLTNSAPERVTLGNIRGASGGLTLTDEDGNRIANLGSAAFGDAGSIGSDYLDEKGALPKNSSRHSAG